MYNEELKSRFISDFTTSISRQKSIKSMFDALEKYESKWGADFYTRTKDEIAPVVEEIAGGRAGSQQKMFFLRAYIQWCLDNDVEGTRGDLFLLEDVGLEKMKHRMVSSPTHLQRYLDYVCYPLSEETNGCIFRCYLWLAYSGIVEGDAFSVRTSDIDLKNSIIFFHGVEFPLYESSLPAFKQCINATRFKVFHASGDRYLDRADGDVLLRSSNGVMSDKGMKVEATRRSRNPYATTILGKPKNDDLELQLCYSRVWLSGVFYRTYELEGAGIKPNFTGLARRKAEGKTYELSAGRNLPDAKIRWVAQAYRTDYYNWKRAFSL